MRLRANYKIKVMMREIDRNNKERRTKMRSKLFAAAILFALGACGDSYIYRGDDDTEPPMPDASVTEDSQTIPDSQIIPDSAPVIPEICFLQKSIVNGDKTNDYPAVVHLKTNMGSCGSILIHTRTLLTSAHCVVGTEDIEVSIVGNTYGVVEKLVHPLYVDNGYDAASFNDVAVLHLNENVSGVIPVPMDAEQVSIGDKVVLVGYGNTRWPNKDHGTKRVGTSVVEWVTDQTIAYEGVNSTCRGDSGGAIYRNNRLAGIAWANPYGSCDRGYAMAVAEFHDWIVENAVGECPSE